MGIPYRKIFIDNLLELDVAKDNPSMMVLFHPSYEWDRYFKDINAIPCHKILWDLESPFELDVIKKGIDHIMYLLIMDKNSADHIKTQYPDKEVKFVPCSCYPPKHSHVNVDKLYKYRSDLCFVGAPFRSRVNFFREVKDALADYYLTIIGYSWHGTMDWGNQNLINDIMPVEEVTKYYSGAKIALNLQRQNSDAWGHNESNVKASSPANRLFEIACSGTCQMVDNSRCPEIFEYFDENEIVVFTSPTDFLEKLKYLMNHPSKRDEIGTRAMKKAQSLYAYRNRIDASFFGLIK
jgi:spore maturation protein CgeB